MSRTGNCYDNAPMESFWGSLKNEMIHHQRYATRANTEAAINEYATAPSFTCNVILPILTSFLSKMFVMRGRLLIILKE
jgi:transposase InsO family protein